MVTRTHGLKRAIIACPVLFGLAVIASLAPSPAAAFTAAQRAACMPDAQRLCSQSLASLSQLNACMSRNSSKVSAGCKAALGGGKKKITKR